MSTLTMWQTIATEPAGNDLASGSCTGAWIPFGRRIKRLPGESASLGRPVFALIVRTGLLFLAGALPVLSIPMHVFGVLPLAVTARWLVLPAALVAVLVMIGRSQESSWARRGFAAGLLAVTAYDMLRMPMVAYGIWPDFIPRLGGWVIGSESPNHVVGYVWRYIGDGGGIALAFFLLCGVLGSLGPRAVTAHPIALSIGYGIFVWSGLVGTIGFSERGAELLFPLTTMSLTLSLLGHLVYGTVLGVCLRYYAPRVASAGVKRGGSVVDDPIRSIQWQGGRGSRRLLHA